MLYSFSRLLPSLTLAAFSLTACGGGDEKPRTVGKSAPEQCEYQYTDGGRALMGNVGRTYYADSGMFGKQYNRYDFEAIAGASGAETVRYADASSIYLRRIPYNGTKDRCLFSEGMQVAPDDILEYWKRGTAGRLNNGEPGRDGLYTMFSYSNGTDVPVILVRTSSQRWTLVHELMHANFHKARKALGQPEDYFTEISRTEDEVSLAMRNYASDRSESNLSEVASAYRKMGDYLERTLVNFALEEVADESFLVEEYAAGRLKYVDKDSLVNAYLYITCSRGKSLEQLNKLSARVRNDVLTPALTNGWSSVMSIAQETMNKVSALDRRAQELAERARQVSGSRPYNCDTQDRVIQAQLEKANPHWAYMTSNNASMRAFSKAMSNLKATREELSNSY